MKKTAVISTILAIMTVQVQAQKISTFDKVFTFGIGYLFGQMSHVGGHIVTYNITKPGIGPMIIAWDKNQFPPIYETVSYYIGTSKKKFAWTDAGGFLGEIVSSEAILATSNLQHGDDYNYMLLGWLAQTVANPLMYSIRDWVTPGGYGDFKDLQDDTGINRHVFEAITLAHAALTVARVFWKLDGTRNIQVSSTPTSVSLTIKF